MYICVSVWVLKSGLPAIWPKMRWAWWLPLAAADVSLLQKPRPHEIWDNCDRMEARRRWPISTYIHILIYTHIKYICI